MANRASDVAHVTPEISGVDRSRVEAARAVGSRQNAVRTTPSDAGAWHALGLAHIQAGEHAQGIEAIQRAIELNSTKASFYNNLGVAFLAQGNAEDAKAAFQKALAINSRYVDAIANLGLALGNLGQPDEAERAYRQVLGIAPNHIGSLYNLGNLLLERGMAEEAIGLYRQVLAIDANRCDVWNNLGRALLDKEEPEEAARCFEQALARVPSFGEAAFNLARVYTHQGRVIDAKRALATAVRSRPKKAMWRWHDLGLCPTVFESVADLDAYRNELEQRLDEATRESVSIDLDELGIEAVVPSFNLAHHGRSNRVLLEKFAALYRAHIPKGNPPHTNRNKKRVGFVVTAPHVGSFLRTRAGVVEHLDATHFEAVVCCCDSAMETLRLGIHRADVIWIPFSRRFSEAAQTIARAECDVLYFHKVSDDPLAYLLPFARLAPVQCTSWSTHCTSGVAEVNYYLSNSMVELPDSAEEYSEQLVRFESFPPFERTPEAMLASCRGQFGLPESGSLYLCPQRVPKFHPAQDELFRRILDEDSSGYLVMLAGRNQAVLAQLMERLRKNLGAAANRLLVLPRQSALGLRQLMSVCDVMLDIREYSSSLTGKDALAAGLPVVTLPGKLKVERYMAAFYRKLGIGDLIATSADDYVHLAVRTGREKDLRKDIQERINVRSPILFEDRECVREFEHFVLSAKTRV